MNILGWINRINDLYGTETVPKRFDTTQWLRPGFRGAGLVDHGPAGVRQGYGSRMTTEEILAFRDKHHTLTSKQVAEKLKGKQGPYGHNITEGSLKQAVFDAGKTGKYGRFILAGRTLKQLKEEAAKLPSGKKYLAEYNKTKNKDEALKVFRNRVQVALGNIAKDPDKRAIQRAKWAKTEKGAASIERSIAKQSIKDTAEIGNFNPGRKPEHRLFHALYRSATQKGSRWELVGKKPDKWTTEASRNAKFLDTKNNKIITLKGLEKYMNTTSDIGSYKDALRPFESKQELQKFLVNYKGKEYKLGHLLNERLFTGEDFKNLRAGTSEIVVNHPDKVKTNWWKGEVAYKDANLELNHLERKFVTKMKRANNDVALENVIKNKFTKEIKKLGPITYKGPYGEFGTKPTSSALVKSMIKPLYKKTQDKALSRTLNTLVKNLEDAEIPCYSTKGGRCDTAADYRKGFNELVQKGAAGDKTAVSKLQKFTNIMKKAKGPLKWTGYGLLAEVGFMLPFAVGDYAAGKSWKRIIGNATDWGFGPMFGQSEDEEIIANLPEGSLGAEYEEALAASERLQALEHTPIIEGPRNEYLGYKKRVFPKARIGMDSQRFKKAQTKVMEDAALDLRNKINPFMEGPRNQFFNINKADVARLDLELAKEWVKDQEAQRIQERRDRGFIAEKDWMKKYSYAGGGLANLTRTVAPDSGPMSQGLRSLYIDDMD